MNIYFKNNVELLRKKNKLSQIKLAESLGVKRSTMSNYERGHTEPDIATLISISRYFGISIDDILLRNLAEDAEYSQFVEKPGAVYQKVSSEEMIKDKSRIIELLETENERLKTEVSDLKKRFQTDQKIL